jgi:hypothetical protein
MTDEKKHGKEAAEKAGSGNPDVLAAWDIRFPIFKSRFYLWDIAKVMILGYILIVILFAITCAFMGEMKILGTVILAMGATWLALGIVIFLVSGVMYAGGYPAAFALTAGGILWASQSQRDKTVSRLSILLGVLDRNPSLIGAGFIAASEESGGIAWENIRRAKIYPKPRAITIKNSWRVVIRLYAKPENFEAVAAIVRERAQNAVVQLKG